MHAKRSDPQKILLQGLHELLPELQFCCVLWGEGGGFAETLEPQQSLHKGYKQQTDLALLQE